MRYIFLLFLSLQLFSQSSGSEIDRPISAEISNDSIKVYGIDTVFTDVQFPYNVDNSGKLEVSQGNSYGEYVLSVDNLPVRFSQATVGTGSQTYNSTFNSQTLQVAANLDVSVFQTRQFHPYFPGNAQQPEFTFIGFQPELDVEKLVGYYNSSTSSPYNANYDGIFLSSAFGIVGLNIAKSGSIILIPQNAWDDPLDGTGASGVTIDWNNFQVVLFDFLYLGGTTVNFYMIFNGKRNLIHSYHHSNNVANTIFDTPSQPLRAEVRSIGGAGTFDFVCGAVSSMGGDIESSGLPTSSDSGSTLINLATAGTKYPIIGIKKSIKSVEHFISDISVINLAGNNESYVWTLEINPTLSSALTYTTEPISTIQEAVGDGAITVTSDGYIIASGYGAARATIETEISRAVRIGQTIDGVFDELILSVTPMQSGQSVAASINSVVVK